MNLTDEYERLARAHAEGAAYLLGRGDEAATAEALLANTYATLALIEAQREREARDDEGAQ